MAVDTTPIENHIKKLQAEKIQPTPEVGTPIIWYPAADVKPNAEIAGLVTKIEDPGRVCVVVFRPDGMPEHKRGCFHVSHEIHKRRHNATSKTSGAWDYPAGVKAPEQHKKRHAEVVKAKKESAAKQLAEAEAINKREAEAGKKQTVS